MRLVKPTNASGQGDASDSKIFPVDNKRGSIAKYKKGKTKNCLVTWRRKKGDGKTTAD
jgi:hypothetical protein